VWATLSYALNSATSVTSVNWTQAYLIVNDNAVVIRVYIRWKKMLTRDANRRQGNVEQARGAQYEFYKNISRLNFQKHTILCYFRVTLGGMQCLIHFSLSGARPQTHVMS